MISAGKVAEKKAHEEKSHRTRAHLDYFFPPPFALSTMPRGYSISRPPIPLSYPCERFSLVLKSFFRYSSRRLWSARISVQCGIFSQARKLKTFFVPALPTRNKGSFSSAGSIAAENILAKVTRKVIREEKGSVTKLNALQQCFSSQNRA